MFTIAPQPVLRQEELWQSERDALRPRDHRQVRVTSLCSKQNGSSKPNSLPCLVSSGSLAFEAAVGLILCTAPFVRVHRWVDVETRWLALWGFSNCLRVVKGSSFICHCSHCEEHFMPRESLALNPEICHKMLSANLLTSISFFCIIIIIVIIIFFF